MAATSRAVVAASAACRTGSAPAISASEAPTSSEIADVTVTAVWRELQNTQNASPPNRHEYRPASGGNPASDASPRPAGSRYAASVMPAAISARSHARSYDAIHERAAIIMLELPRLAVCKS